MPFNLLGLRERKVLSREDIVEFPGGRKPSLCEDAPPIRTRQFTEQDYLLVRKRIF